MRGWTVLYLTRANTTLYLLIHSLRGYIRSLLLPFSIIISIIQTFLKPHAQNNSCLRLFVLALGACNIRFPINYPMALKLQVCVLNVSNRRSLCGWVIIDVQIHTCRANKTTLSWQENITLHNETISLNNIQWMQFWDVYLEGCYPRVNTHWTDMHYSINLCHDRIGIKT